MEGHMKQKVFASGVAVLCIVMLISLVGCGSNVSEIKSSDIPTAPTSKTYPASMDKVWGAALSYIAEHDSITVSDKGSGLIVTNYRTVDGKELSLVSTSFLGSTYKYAYTINMVSDSANATTVRISVKLEKEQMAMLKREAHDEKVENYLRNKFFKGLESKM
jgi:uncharacterized protein YceK